MRKSFVKQLLASLIAILMLFSFAACGGGKATTDSNVAGTSSSSTTGDGVTPKPLVTLKITGDFKGMTDNQDEVTQEIKRLTNIQLEYVDANEEKYKLLVATNDLGDITFPVLPGGSAAVISMLIKGKQVIALDDLLKTNGQDLIKNTPQALQVLRDTTVDPPEAKGHIWCISSSSNTGMDAFVKQPIYEVSMGPYIRWDYYNEIGAPAINNEDDLLNVLALMQKAHPKTADGKKVYGLAFWSDWGSFGYENWYQNCNGYGIESDWLTSNQMDYTYSPTMINANSQWWNAIKFLNKANRLGLLDPESFTMKGDDAKTKVMTGNLLMLQHSWNNQEINTALQKTFGPKAGMGAAVGAFPGYYGNVASRLGGGNKIFITSACKTPERAMDFINWMSTPEAGRLIYSGVEGKHWNKVNGKAELTDETIQASLTDPDFTKKTGIKREGLRNYSIIANSNLDSDGVPLDLFLTEKYFSAKTNTVPFYKDYCAQLGVSYPGQLVDKLGKQWYNFDTSVYNFMPTYPDDIKRIQAKVMDMFKKDYPKMILAKSDAEFDNLKAKAIEGYLAADAAKVDKFYQDQLKLASDKNKSYK